MVYFYSKKNSHVDASRPQPLFMDFAIPIATRLVILYLWLEILTIAPCCSRWTTILLPVVAEEIENSSNDRSKTQIDTLATSHSVSSKRESKGNEETVPPDEDGGESTAYDSETTAAVQEHQEERAVGNQQQQEEHEGEREAIKQNGQPTEQQETQEQRNQIRSLEEGANTRTTLKQKNSDDEETYKSTTPSPGDDTIIVDGFIHSDSSWWDLYKKGCHEYHYRSSKKEGVRDDEICQNLRNLGDVDVDILNSLEGEPPRDRSLSSSSCSYFWGNVTTDIMEEVQNHLFHCEGASLECMMFQRDIYPWGSTNHVNYWNSPTYSLNSNFQDFDVYETLLDEIQTQIIDWKTTCDQPNSCPQQQQEEDETRGSTVGDNVCVQGTNKNGFDKDATKYSSKSLDFSSLSPVVNVKLYTPGSILPLQKSANIFDVSAYLTIAVYENNITSKQNETSSTTVDDSCKSHHLDESSVHWPFHITSATSSSTSFSAAAIRSNANAGGSDGIVEMISNSSIKPGDLLLIQSNADEALLHGRLMPLPEGYYVVQLEMHFTFLDRKLSSTKKHRKQSKLRDMYHKSRNRNASVPQRDDHVRRIPNYLSTAESRIWRQLKHTSTSTSSNHNYPSILTHIRVEDAILQYKNKVMQEKSSSSKNAAKKNKSDSSNEESRSTLSSSSSRKKIIESGPAANQLKQQQAATKQQQSVNDNVDNKVNDNNGNNNIQVDKDANYNNDDRDVSDEDEDTNQKATGDKKRKMSFNLFNKKKEKVVSTKDSYAEDLDWSDAHKAAERGDLDALERILMINPDAIHQLDENGWTPLHEAVQAKDVSTISFLLSRGAKVNAPTLNGMTPLLLAYNRVGVHHPVYIFLKKRGAKLIEPQDEDTEPRVTSAHTAAKDGDFKSLRAILMDDKTAVNRRDENGWTPLHEASRKGNKRIIHILINAGAEVNVKTNQDLTPLFFALQKTKNIDHPVVKLLLSEGAIIAEKEDHLAHFAAREGDWGWLEIIQLANPEWLDIADDNGWRPIHEAAHAGRAKVVKFLIENKAQVNAVTNSGHTALNLAIEQYGDDHPVTKVLLENHAA